MKQKFMKKALAVALSTAMVFSASSVAGRTEGLQTEISKQYAELED